VKAALRTALGLMLAMTVIGGLCVPATAQAAARRHQAAIQWSQASMDRTMTHGHEVVVVTRFRTARTIHSAQFGIRLSGGLYARPAILNAGPIAAHRWHGLAFVIGVPARVNPGQYRALVQLEQREGRHDVDRIGAPLVIAIHVTAAALVTWMPPRLGTIKLLQGQTVTDTVSFTSTMALTSVQIRSDLSSAEVAHGVTLDVVSMNPATTTVAAGVPISVTLAVSAAPTATLGTYPAGLHVEGSFNGGPVVHLARDIYVEIVVAPVTPLVTWVNGSPMSFPTITRGTATVGVTETASLTSNVSLSNVSLVGRLSDKAIAQGLTITPVSVPGGAIAANTPVPVSFVIGVPATSHPGVYSGAIWLTGQWANATASVDGGTILPPAILLLVQGASQPTL
jgi:hypothetical protein